MRVHLAGEHAPELEQLELLGHALNLTDDVVERARILLFGRELVKLAGLVERLLDPIQRRDDGFELGAFLPELLRALGVGPHSGILELAVDFLEPLALGVIVKDTSATLRNALSARRWRERFGSVPLNGPSGLAAQILARWPRDGPNHALLYDGSCRTARYMQLTRDGSAVHFIRAWEPGRLRVADRWLTGNVIVGNDEIIEGWTSVAPHRLTLADLEPALALKPTIVVLGTGARTVAAGRRAHGGGAPRARSASRS